MTLDENVRIGPLVAKMPIYAKVFEKAGIDYCCKGKSTLKELCAEKNLDPSDILTQLNAMETTSPTMNWDTLSTPELIAHIIEKHHRYLKEELPRISQLIHKVAARHGESRPELLEIRSIFEVLYDELLVHLQEEEEIVFPLIQGKVPSLKDQLIMLENDHYKVGEALEKIHSLTKGYTPPPQACATYRVMLSSLSLLEKDMHEHITKENHILFPRCEN